MPAPRTIFILRIGALLNVERVHSREHSLGGLAGRKKRGRGEGMEERKTAALKEITTSRSATLRTVRFAGIRPARNAAVARILETRSRIVSFSFWPLLDRFNAPTGAFLCAVNKK